MQAGSDGAQACASCHFQAGADVRTTNTVNPGANGLFNSVVGAGATLTGGQFPIKTGDIVGSQGVIDTNFIGLSGGALDTLLVIPDPLFNFNGEDVRQCTGRNAPFAVNAVFTSATSGTAGRTTFLTASPHSGLPPPIPPRIQVG